MLKECGDVAASTGCAEIRLRSDSGARIQEALARLSDAIA